MDEEKGIGSAATLTVLQCPNCGGKLTLPEKGVSTCRSCDYDVLVEWIGPQPEKLPQPWDWNAPLGTMYTCSTACVSLLSYDEISMRTAMDISGLSDLIDEEEE